MANDEHFGKYVDVTQFAKSLVDEGVEYDGYKEPTKVYVCRDTNNWWISIITEGLNEDYEEDEGAVLIERNNIYLDDAKTHRGVVRAHAKNGWEGWDSYQADSLEDAIEVVDGGYGIVPEVTIKKKKKKSSAPKM